MGNTAVVWLHVRCGFRRAPVLLLDSRSRSRRPRAQTSTYASTGPRRIWATTYKTSTPTRPDGRDLVSPDPRRPCVLRADDTRQGRPPPAIGSACQAIRSWYRSGAWIIALAGRSASASSSQRRRAITLSVSGVANAPLHRARPSPAPIRAWCGRTPSTPRAPSGSATISDEGHHGLGQRHRSAPAFLGAIAAGAIVMLTLNQQWYRRGDRSG